VVAGPPTAVRRNRGAVIAAAVVLVARPPTVGVDTSNLAGCLMDAALRGGRAPAPRGRAAAHRLVRRVAPAGRQDAAAPGQVVSRPQQTRSRRAVRTVVEPHSPGVTGTLVPYHGVAVRTATPALVALVTLFVLSASACAAARRPQRPDTGTVTVGVTTSGSDVSAITFRVTVETAGISGSVKADAGVFTRSEVPSGDHVVRLLDLPARCRVEGPAERTITISQARRSAALRFHVVCGVGERR
jgi:hypothetical protein